MTTNRLRYGIFLRPDAATCWNVTQVTLALERQFGIVSAGAYPPHATLVGNLCSAVDEASLVEILDGVFADIKTFTVHNHGVAHKWGVYVYDIDRNAAGDNVNPALHEVAQRARRALLPVSVPVADHLVKSLADQRFEGHLSLASHDLLVREQLAPEVGEFIASLPIVPPPVSFEARWYSLFAFDADWTSEWWTAMTWRHVRSWSAQPTASIATPGSSSQSRR